MVEPVTAMAAMAVGKEIFGFIDDANKAVDTERRYQANRLSAITARDLKIQALNTRAIQEAERISGSKLENTIKALQTIESKVVAAGESGLEGQTIDGLLAETEARRLRGDTIFNQALKNTLQQINFEKQGVDAEALNRINSLERGRKPNPLGLLAKVGFAVGTAALAYGGKGSQLTEQTLPSVVPMGGGDPGFFGGT